MKITLDVDPKNNPDRHQEIRDCAMKCIRFVTLIPKGYPLLWLWRIANRLHVARSGATLVGALVVGAALAAIILMIWEAIELRTCDRLLRSPRWFAFFEKRVEVRLLTDLELLEGLGRVFSPSSLWIGRDVRIEHDVHLGWGCVICSGTRIPANSVIGEEVFIGEGVRVYGHFMAKNRVQVHAGAQLRDVTLEEGVIVGTGAVVSDVWLSSGSCVKPSAHIGSWEGDS